LSWSETERDVADTAESVVGAGPLGAVRLKLDDRLEGNPEQSARRLAKAFIRLPSHRLVVLGEPGAGKTFLAITLSVGLLRERRSGDPVPVFLSLSSWDPVATTLDDWIANSLAQTHYGGRTRTPRALLARGLLLPVLDGLDELPEHLRRQAISRVNDTLAEGDRPLVLTCRSVEYEEGIAGGAPVLLRAPVVEVRPVTPDDVVAHLAAEGAADEVVRHVREHPDSPLSTALSTPLMLSLFTASHRDRDPADLLEPGRFTSRHAVEDHLVDLLVDTVYPASGPTGQRWTAADARRWLTYLARYLHRHGERDFAWWKLAQRELSPWVAPVLGLLVGVAVFVVASLAFQTEGDPSLLNGGDPVSTLLGSPPLVATTFGVVVASLWLAGARRGPDQTADDVSGFGHGAVTGSSLVLVPGVPSLLVAFSLGSFDNSDELAGLLAMGSALLALALVSGLAVGLHELLVARSERTAWTSPEDALHRDRRSAWSATAVTSLVVAVSSVLAASLAMAVGGHIGQRIAVSVGLPTIAHPDLPPLPTHVLWRLDDLPSLVRISVVLAVLFAVAVLTTRAWTRFAVARVVLAVAHRLPLGVMAFLADARQRGLLRGAGPVYQFWHVRLQERLVATTQDAHTGKRPPKPLVVLAALVVLVVPVVLVGWQYEPEDCRPTGWPTVDARQERVIMSGASLCAVKLDPWEARLLVHEPDDAALLAAVVGDPAPTWGPWVQVTVHGEFDQVAPATWHHLLRGLAAARQAATEKIRIAFLHSDPERLDAADVNRLRTYALGRGDRSPKLFRAVSVDRAETWIEGGFDSRLNIGLGDVDLPAQAAEVRDELMTGWLDAFNELSPTALHDGGDAVCTDLSTATERSSLAYFYLRGTVPLTDQLKRIAECGEETAVLIDPERVDEVSALGKLPEGLRVFHLRDESATIEPDCREALGEDVHPESLRACMATISAAENYRISLERVEPA
jgi:hypothetical protein